MVKLFHVYYQTNQNEGTALMRLFISSIATILITFQAISTTYSPQNLIIATDLDDVVLQKNWGGILGTVIKNITSLGKARNAYKKFKKTNSTAKDIRTGGEAFYIYLTANKNDPLAEKLLKACTHKYPITGTVSIMQSLASQGYEIYTATNMGPLFFAAMQKKYPAIFNETCIRTGLTVDYAQPDIIKKPDPRYFEELKKRLNPNNDKHLLFIDDKLENVNAARKAGLLAIHFKNPKQLRSALHKYGICVRS